MLKIFLRVKKVFLFALIVSVFCISNVAYAQGGGEEDFMISIWNTGSVNIQAEVIISFIVDAGLNDYINMNPVSGLTLVTTCGEVKFPEDFEIDGSWASRYGTADLVTDYDCEKISIISAYGVQNEKTVNLINHIEVIENKPVPMEISR